MKYLVLILFIGLSLSIPIEAQPSIKKRTSKIKGVSFRGPDEAPLKDEMIAGVKVIQAEWISFVPAAILNRYTLAIEPESRRYHWYETKTAIIQSIQMAQSQGYKIALKPHLKLLPVDSTFQKKLDKTNKAKWRGDIKFDKEEDWQTFETNYEAFILEWVAIADSLSISLFCVGTELKQFAVKRPQFWQQLINKTREIYNGQIIYSANWDEYAKIEFWNELDYIGMNIYFPVSLTKVPKVTKTNFTWRWYLKRIKKVSKQFELPVLVTEFGYRSREYAALNPWVHEKEKAKVNHQAQYNLYEAFFQSFWKKKWIAGAFLWQWQAVAPADAENTLFTPQGKPALEVLKKWYESE